MNSDADKKARHAQILQAAEELALVIRSACTPEAHAQAAMILAIAREAAGA